MPEKTPWYHYNQGPHHLHHSDGLPTPGSMLATVQARPEIAQARNIHAPSTFSKSQESSSLPSPIAAGSSAIGGGSSAIGAGSSASFFFPFFSWTNKGLSRLRTMCNLTGTPCAGGLASNREFSHICCTCLSFICKFNKRKATARTQELRPSRCRGTNTASSISACGVEPLLLRLCREPTLILSLGTAGRLASHANKA